ncbi:MAG: protoporphyrinogen/coproporphyrinogen oxidase [Candidatus Binataceae bacterium]|nr:protoporphyrinogen/coproporphyrinogen oxidase [Candidatus Binataceae bacterium]
MDSSKRSRRVAIIGGGISGLAAAFRLRELAAAREMPLEIAIFERGPRLGGALDTIRRDGFVIEAGADSFLSEKPAAAKLVERLGIASELISTQEQFRKTFVVRDGHLVEIPEGFSLLAPTWFGALIKSPLFSTKGKLRIMIEPLIPRRRATDDESLGAFVRRRLGREVLSRVAQPLAGGIYTADPELLSIGATMPRFVEMERRYGSVIRGLRVAARNRNTEVRGTSGARWSLFLGFKDGIRTIVDKLADRLDGSIHFGAELTAIKREPEAASPDGSKVASWRLEFRDGTNFDADAIICAAPAFATAPMLQPIAGELASLLAAIKYASAATVNMAFRTVDFPRPPAAFGFVVPVVERRRIIAGSFSSLKFAGRAPAGMILARAFMGGALQTEMMNLDDAEMIAAAREEFASLLGVTAEPALTCVRRWPDSMPQYAVGHLDRVSKIERAVEGIPGLTLAGAYLRGVGIPDCIASSERAAETTFAQLAPQT